MGCLASSLADADRDEAVAIRRAKRHQQQAIEPASGTVVSDTKVTRTRRESTRKLRRPHEGDDPPPSGSHFQSSVARKPSAVLECLPTSLDKRMSASNLDLHRTHALNGHALTDSTHASPSLRGQPLPSGGNQSHIPPLTIVQVQPNSAANGTHATSGSPNRGSIRELNFSRERTPVRERSNSPSSTPRRELGLHAGANVEDSPNRAPINARHPPTQLNLQSRLRLTRDTPLGDSPEPRLAEVSPRMSARMSHAANIRTNLALARQVSLTQAATFGSGSQAGAVAGGHSPSTSAVNGSSSSSSSSGSSKEGWMPQAVVVTPAAPLATVSLPLVVVDPPPPSSPIASPIAADEGGRRGGMLNARRAGGRGSGGADSPPLPPSSGNGSGVSGASLLTLALPSVTSPSLDASTARSSFGLSVNDSRFLLVAGGNSAQVSARSSMGGGGERSSRMSTTRGLTAVELDLIDAGMMPSARGGDVVTSPASRHSLRASRQSLGALVPVPSSPSSAMSNGHGAASPEPMLDSNGNIVSNGAHTNGNRRSRRTTGGALSSRGRRRTALVVDNNLLSQRLSSVALHRCGYIGGIEFATEGESAISMAGSAFFDMILIDSTLPTLSGIETVNAIRWMEEQRGDQPAMVVCLTSAVSPADLEAYRLAKFDACVERGAVLQEVLALVVDLLGANPNFLFIASSGARKQDPRTAEQEAEEVRVALARGEAAALALAKDRMRMSTNQQLSVDGSYGGGISARGSRPSRHSNRRTTNTGKSLPIVRKPSIIAAAGADSLHYPHSHHAPASSLDAARSNSVSPTNLSPRHAHAMSASSAFIANGRASPSQQGPPSPTSPSTQAAVPFRPRRASLSIHSIKELQQR